MINRTLLLLFLSACQSRETATLLSYYEAESSSRAVWLAGHSAGDSSIVNYFRRETSGIILLSKDSENPEASVYRAGRLLDTICAKFPIRRSDFTDITPEMSIDETELQLRENELGVLNRLVLLRSEKEGFIFSAH